MFENKSLPKGKLLLISLLTAGTLIIQSTAMAQIKVGANPETINASAILDVESTTKGILFPRVALTSTTSFAPLAAHVAGMNVYNTATAGDVTPGAYYNDGTQWLRLITEVPEATQLFGSNAPTGTCSAATMYNDTLETSATLGKQWVCAGGVWKAYKAPQSTPFYLYGTTNDAGSVKSGVIYRNGSVFLQRSDGTGYAQIWQGGAISLYRNLVEDPLVGAVIDFKGANSNIHRIGIRNDYAGAGALAISVIGNAPTLVATTTGRIGIGVTNPLAPLHVSANSTGANLILSKPSSIVNEQFLQFTVTGSIVGSISRTAAGVAYNTASDKRLKENIKGTHYAIQDLMKINVVDYNFKSDKSKSQVTGFIAQELYKIFPGAVTVGGENVKENPWTVDYSKVTPLLVKAIQDQQAEIAALKAEQVALHAQNRALQAQVSKVEEFGAKLGALEATLEALVPASTKAVSVSR